MLAFPLMRRPAPGLLPIALLAVAACLPALPAAGAKKKEPAKPAATPAADMLAASLPKNSFLVRAYAFDRSNAEVYTNQWADAEPMLATGDARPIFADYDIDFPLCGEFTISVFYSAAGVRPVEMLLDGKEIGRCCRKTTGSWNTSKAQWEEACKVFVAQGKRTLTLRSTGIWPHVVALRFDSYVPLPEGWTLLRPTANKLSDRPSRRHETVPSGLAYVPGEASAAAVRLAIADLAATFGPRYPHAAEYLRRLEGIEAKLKALADQDGQIDAKNRGRQGDPERTGRPAKRGPAGQSAAGLREAVAGQAGREVARARPAAELAEQFQPAQDRLRRRDRGALARAARRPADHALQARRRAGSSATWTCTSTRTDCCSPCPATTATGRCSRSARDGIGPAAAHRRATRRGQLRRLLPAQRQDHLHLDGLFPGVPCVYGSDARGRTCT